MTTLDQLAAHTPSEVYRLPLDYEDFVASLTSADSTGDRAFDSLSDADPYVEEFEALKRLQV